MPKKTHPFSIYLLKENEDASSSLDEKYIKNKDLIRYAADNIPDGSTLYIFNKVNKEAPWWCEFFNVKKAFTKPDTLGALLFIPLSKEKRCFVLSFGIAFHCLKAESYEYDFGLLVTLNCLDPKKLKSADAVAPGPARRTRTQVPIATELTYLDFDGNSEILRNLTGKVREDYKSLFKSATGSANLKVSMKITPDEQLIARCSELLKLYQSDDYKKYFPNIQNIVPEKDPTLIKNLEKKLETALQRKDESVSLTFPEMVEFTEATNFKFRGPHISKAQKAEPDLSIDNFYKYLKSGFDLNTLTLDALKSYRMMLTDENGAPLGSNFSIYRGLIYETEQEDKHGKKQIYLLNDGNWYNINTNFISRITDYLNKKCESNDLPIYDTDDEGKYNNNVPAHNGSFICLDKKNIAPDGSTPIEPCDLYQVIGETASLYHIKRSTRSALLSHLFNQGANSIELLLSDIEEPRTRMKEFTLNNIGSNNKNTYLEPISHRNFKVIFGIITKKDSKRKSNNLPLFSKISLSRNMRHLDAQRVPCALTFIHDESS